MTFYLLNTLSFLISLLGFRGIRILSYTIGILAFDIVRIRRKIILSNLDIVYHDTISHSKKQKIGRMCMINFITTALEFLSAKHLAHKAQFEFINQGLPSQLVYQNKGVYTICMHFGNWEYLCHINAKIYNKPVHVVVKDVLSGKSEEWIKNLRHSLGYNLIDRQSKISAAQQIFNAIDNGEIVGFIVDQRKPNGPMIPFFGQEASTNTGLSKLYFRKPAPLVCATIIRKKPGIFCVEYFKFEYQKNDEISLSENITQMMRQVHALLEPIILKHPEEYYWLHNRWKKKI